MIAQSQNHNCGSDGAVIKARRPLEEDEKLTCVCYKVPR